MSQIKLLHSGGNGVILAAPSSNPASDRTLTLPGDADGTIATTATAGKILQTVQTVKTDTTSTSSTTMTDCSGMSVTITPSSASNKILVTVVANIGANSGYRAMMQILRGSTAIGIGTDVGSRQACGMSTRYADVGYTHNAVQTFLDSPNTTSATTYKLQWRNEASNNMYLNRSYGDTNNSTYQRTVSMIMVQEVAA